MDPVHRLQFVHALIQLDDQQNIVALQHQHQQVIRQRRLRHQWWWWCRLWLLRRPAFEQLKHLMVDLRIEDPACFQNFVRCEPAMFQEMVDRLSLLICKLDTNYRKALDPVLKVDIALWYMATGDSSKSLQYGFHVAYNSICFGWSLQTTTATSDSTIIALGQSMVSMWQSGNLWRLAHTITTIRTFTS